MIFGEIQMTNDNKCQLALEFRDITEEDIWITYQMHLEFLKYVNTVRTKNKITSLEEHKEFVRKFINNKESHPFKNWEILIYNNEAIGYFAIKKSNEFGYVILAPFQNKGLGKEAFKLFFKKHNPDELWARSNIHNTRSHHLLEKYGFEKTDFEFHRSDNSIKKSN